MWENWLWLPLRWRSGTSICWATNSRSSWTTEASRNYWPRSYKLPNNICTWHAWWSMTATFSTGLGLIIKSLMLCSGYQNTHLLSQWSSLFLAWPFSMNYIGNWPVTHNTAVSTKTSWLLRHHTLTSPLLKTLFWRKVAFGCRRTSQ